MSKGFELEDLLAGIAHPTRIPAHPEETTSSTGIASAESQPATTRNHPHIPAPPEDTRVNMRVVRVHAGEEPASPDTVQDSANADHAGLRVGGGIPAQRETLTTRILEPGKRHEEDPTSRERKIAELIARYQAGQFTQKVRARLTEIFTDNPSDAEERLLKACTHVGITGEGLEEADRLAQEVYDRRVH